MKRLYEVRAEVVVYVLAEPDEVQDVGGQALRDEVGFNNLEADAVEEVTRSKWPLANMWSRESLVYGADTDTTLGDALDSVGVRS